MIKGRLEEQYARVWDYAVEIFKSNPISTCKVRVDGNLDRINYFKRFYVCFKDFKDGWNKGCKEG